MTRGEAAELVAILASAYHNARPTEQTLLVYERMLGDLDFQTAQGAIAKLMVSSKFFPSIAEIRAAAVEVTSGEKRLGGEAWGDVTMAIRQVGSYGEPTFKDPDVAHSVRMMGWKSLCLSTNETADRARFIELYEGVSKRSRKQAVEGQSLSLPVRGKLSQLPGFGDIGAPKLSDGADSQGG